MSIKSLATFVVAGLLFVAVPTGCGSSSDSDSLAETISKAEYVKRADTICASAEADKNRSLTAAMRRVGRDSPTLTKVIQEELVLDVAIPPIKRMSDELAGLGAPDGEEGRAMAMVAAFEAEIEALESNPGSVAEGTGGEFEKANELANAFGMKACAAI